MSDVTNASTAELTAELEKIDADRLALRGRGRAVKAALAERLHNDHCDYWGVTPEQYAEVKTAAAGAGMPLHEALNKTRAANFKAIREAQTARASTKSLKATAKGV